jgi:hypothetical protein
MTSLGWAARVLLDDQGLRLVLSEPAKELPLTADVARQLAAMLLLAAESVTPDPDPQRCTVSNWGKATVDNLGTTCYYLVQPDGPTEPGGAGRI